MDATDFYQAALDALEQQVNGAPEEAMQAALCVTNPELLERFLLSRGCDPGQVGSTLAAVRSLREGCGSGHRLRAWLWEAYTSAGGTTEVELQGPESMTQRWPSGIRDLDFYGFVVIGGNAGAGKSMLAMTSAIEAVRQGIHVIYLDAELSEAQLRRRFAGWGGRALDSYDLASFHVYSIATKATLTDLFDCANEYIDDCDERVLLVCDSINTVATALGTSYFDDLRSLINFFRQARRLSEGRIGVIAVSELNKRGVAKGEQIEYSGDLIVRLQLDENRDGVCELTVTKGREGGRGKYGTYELDWQVGRFVKL